MGGIGTVVIPAAGMGTRFLPATKALPKEMVPLGDRPVIQWGLEEAVASGIGRAVIVVSPGKELIKTHFSPDPALVAVLEQRGSHQLARRVREISELCRVEFREQPEPLGLGDAVRCAAEAVAQEEAVAALLPDDVFLGATPLLRQLVDIYAKEGCTVLALRRCRPEESSRYGMALVKGAGPLFEVLDVVEKPPPAEAPSDLALMGRYILSQGVFQALGSTGPGSGGEIQLTDAIREVARRERVVGLEFSGRLLDVGTLEGWIASQAEVVWDDPELGPRLRQRLLELAREGS